MRADARVAHRDADDDVIAEFIASWRIIRPCAVPVEDAALLPPRLEAHARSLRGGYFWRAWQDGVQLRFVVMRASRSVQAIQAMEAHFFDESSALVSAGIWNRAAPGRWLLVDRFDSAGELPFMRRARPGDTSSAR